MKVKTVIFQGLWVSILVLAALTGCLDEQKTVSAGDRPNIVLIMADDVGLEVLGCYGGTSYQTPNIDKLAQNGIRFTNCYSTPKCSPSRVTIMTGRYLFRTTEIWGHIPAEEKTFGHMLKSAGYRTALAGKWQMCLLKENPNHITKMGFDQNCVFGWHEGARYHQPYIWQNGKIRDDVKDLYGPDIYCDFLIDFIKKNKDKPFLAYYPMAIAHEVSNDFLPPPPPGPDGRYQSYKELVEYMDVLVGRIIDSLERLGLREKTIILFTTDNGTPKKFITRIEDGEYISEPIISMIGNATAIGGKGELTDAGTHVPLIVDWPGVAPAGTICDDLIDFSDFLPTLAELSNASLPPNVIIDGKSFAPQIRGEKGKPREWIFNQFEGKAWVRTKQWKLYEDGRFFDMITDPQENNPVEVKDMDELSLMEREKLQKVFNQLRSSK